MPKRVHAVLFSSVHPTLIHFPIVPKHLVWHLTRAGYLLNVCTLIFSYNVECNTENLRFPLSRTLTTLKLTKKYIQHILSKCIVYYTCLTSNPFCMNICQILILLGKKAEIMEGKRQNQSFSVIAF